MKRLASLILCLSLVAEAAPSSGKTPRGQASAHSTSAARRAPVPALPGEPWVVDIQELVPSLRPMPQKEVEDQLRDWALYGLLMRLELGADELSRTTHQLAPVRLPYLEEMFAFEYGRGRRAILSDKKVLLLYEEGDPDPQATLGRLADRVRVELGQVPGSFELYTFTSDVTAGELKLEFKEAVSGRELFSPKYGYHEAVVTSSQELESWLAGVDDVVFVAKGPKGLKLGGRRFEKSRTRSVTLEDVAVLYQAHVALAARKEEQLERAELFRPQLRLELLGVAQEEAQRAYRMFPFDQKAQRQEVDARMKARAQEFWASVFQRMPYVPPEPGFSLDPRLNERGFVDSLRSLAAEPCRALQELVDKTVAAKKRLAHTKAWPGSYIPAALIFQRDIKEIRERCAALGRDPYYSREFRKIATAARGLLSGVSQTEALEPFFALKGETSSPKDEMADFVDDVLELVLKANKNQCARYDGPLGGTRVGMNLFYTDLLAKLWAMLDVDNEAPGLRVPGFISVARLSPSPYAEDLKKRSTRLWFGPKKEAYTRSPEGTEVRFRHVATRVFAAGSDPNQLQMKEGTPNEHSRRALNWWERHYAEVADYEQEYHLQNQIMKWSVITGYFHEQRLASYLELVPVSRVEQFGKWYAQHRSELKYQLPLEVEGLPSLECMDILGTASGMSGGVSLSGGRLSQVPVVKPTGPANLRHSVKAITGGEPVAKVVGRALPEHVGPGVIKVDPLPTTTVRNSATQLELGTVKLVHARPQPGSYQLSLHASETPVGSFSGVNAAKRTTLRWQPQQMGHALGMAQKAGPKGEAVYVSVQNVSNGTSKTKTFQPWRAEVHGPGGQVQITSALGEEMTWVQVSTSQLASKAEPSRAGHLLANYDWQRLHIAEGAAGRSTTEGVIRTAMREGPGPGATTVRVMGIKDFPLGLDVVVSKSGAVYVPRPGAIGSSVQSWVNLDTSAAFTPRSLPKIREAGLRGQKTILISELSHPEADLGVRALVEGDKAGFTRNLTVLEKELGPEQGRLAMRNQLQDTADLRLTRGDTRGASRLYDLDKEHFGQAAPDVQIKAVLADLSTGRSDPKVLAGMLSQHSSKLSLGQREQVVKAAHGLAEMRDVSDVVRAGMGFDGPIPPSVARSIRLEKVGPDIVSSYRLEKPLRIRQLTPDELKKGMPQGSSIYAEEGLPFNKNDFQVSPAENLAELGRNPEVEVVLIREMETGPYRPAQLVAKEGTAVERTYQRVAGPREGEASVAPIFLIRRLNRTEQAPSCDKNGDGQVSEEERQQCKAA